jgi:glycosyltransferase involved in cell wall biosynthesis
MDMKLLCLGPMNVVPPDDGGKEGIFGALAAIAKRAEVTYAYPGGQGIPSAPAAYGAAGIRAVPVAFAPRESPGLVAAATLTLLPYKFAKHATQEAVRAFAVALKDARFDAIVCFRPHMVSLAERLLVRRGQQVPIILREHNLEYALIESYARSLGAPLRVAASAYAWITRREEQRLWQRVGAVALLSDGDMASARATGVRDVNFLLAAEGVPLPPVRSARWPGGSAALLVLFNPRVPQNVANLRIFFNQYWTKARSTGSMRKTPLVITGVGQSELARLLRTSTEGLAALGVRAVGFVDCLADLFASSLALVSPTFVGAGVRKKVLEAMAHQLPVIATPMDVRSCSFYEPGLNILCMDSVEGFVHGVGRLAEDRLFWESLSRAARATVERHADWDRFAEALTAEAARLAGPPAGTAARRGRLAAMADGAIAR